MDFTEANKTNSLICSLYNSKDCLEWEPLGNLLPCGVLLVRHDETYSIIYANDIFCEMTGYTRRELSELFHNNLTEMMPENDKDKTMSFVSFQAIRSTVTESNYRIRTKDGRDIWLLDKSRLVLHDGQLLFLCTLIDISAHRQEINTLTEKTERDALTGLYNRMSGQALIEEFLKGEKAGHSAFMALDIDYFKVVNDTYGHLIGDVVLSDLGGLLNKQFRSTDIVCRIGGDEFIIFIKELPSQDFAIDKANELLKAVSGLKPGDMDDLTVSCSIGISIYPDNGDNFLSLYEKADIALYDAKSKGRGRAILFKDINWVKTAE